jgi:transcriptional regulator with GAF, ATPase, and Fis domain
MSETREIIKTLQPVLTALAEASLAACEGVLARVWLAGPGDVCASCPMADECRERVTCLHLVASAGHTSRLDGPFRRFPIGARVVGRVPVTHETLIAREDLPALGVASPGWLSLHGVRSLAALPLDHAERCIGVLAVFSSGVLPEEQLRVLTALAPIGAAAIGNVEAFRAMAVERNRLAARNARLRAGLGLEPEPTPTAPAATPSGIPIGAVTAAGAMLHADAAAQQTAASFAEIQRAGIVRALERASWRVSGPRGAATALGLKPTTLESKMKRLGIRRPVR